MGELGLGKETEMCDVWKPAVIPFFEYLQENVIDVGMGEANTVVLTDRGNYKKRE